MKTTKFLLVIGIIAAIFSACSKGDTGATGPAGTNGTNGNNGTNGVANISSNIFSIAPGSWSTISGGYGVNIADDSIKNANTDGIEVFISTNGTSWIGLPISNLFASGDQMDYVYQNNQIALAYLYSSAPTTTIDLKVVVIPPAEMVLHPNTNWHDYSQVNAIMQTEAVHKN